MANFNSKIHVQKYAQPTIFKFKNKLIKLLSDSSLLLSLSLLNSDSGQYERRIKTREVHGKREIERTRQVYSSYCVTSIYHKIMLIISMIRDNNPPPLSPIIDVLQFFVFIYKYIFFIVVYIHVQCTHFKLSKKYYDAHGFFYSIISIFIFLFNFPCIISLRITCLLFLLLVKYLRFLVHRLTLTSYTNCSGLHGSSLHAQVDIRSMYREREQCN